MIMKTLRAILIDPHAKTVTETVLPADEEQQYEAMRTLIFGEHHKSYLEHTVIANGVGGMLDEEGMLTDWDEQTFFALGGGQHARTFAGRMLLIGEDGWGNTRTLLLPLDVAASEVHWLHPKEVRVPSPTLTTWDKDGNEEVTTLDGGTGMWDYNNQPQ